MRMPRDTVFLPSETKKSVETDPTKLGAGMDIPTTWKAGGEHATRFAKNANQFELHTYPNLVSLALVVDVSMEVQTTSSALGPQADNESKT